MPVGSLALGAGGGAAAPTVTTAAETTVRTASLRVPGRPIRTSRRDSQRSVARLSL
ncbi:protein of unknown function [Streptomyces murinus]